MIVSSLAGCIGGEEVDTSEYEDQIAELEEMLEAQNQTIARRDATIDGLQDGLSDATQMIQDHEEGIAILEAYRDSLVALLEDSNNSNNELYSMIEAANNSIIMIQSELSLQQNLVAEWILRALENNFSNANLSNFDLSYSDLTEADLTGADLSNANLTGADLTQADLTGADLSNANLRNIRAIELHGCPTDLPTNWQCVQNNLVGPYANLFSADLRRANLSGIDLTSANLVEADLYGADLTGADLTGADLRNIWAIELHGCPAVLPTNWQCVQNNLVGPYAKLPGADLRYGNLSGIDLASANLSYADLRFADLNGADLSGADLRFADLSGADLSGADLSRAVLFYATLRNANLTGAELTDVYWVDTICPDGTNSDNNGMTCENNL